MLEDDEDLLGEVYNIGKPCGPRLNVNQNVSSADIALLLGVTSRTVSELRTRGVIASGRPGVWPLKATISAYCAHLRKGATGRPSSGRKLTDERERLTRAQADKAELCNAQTRRELLPVADVKREWLAIATDLRNAILAIPSRVGARLSLDRTQVAALDEEIRLLLDNLDAR